MEEIDTSGVDYAALLVKYIAHVSLEEGDDYIDKIWNGRGRTSFVEFSDEEVEALKEAELQSRRYNQ